LITKENTVSNISITNYNLQRIVDRLLIPIKRLIIACLSVYIMSTEESNDGLFIYGIYGALNNVQLKGWTKRWKDIINDGLGERTH
jgi:hypothetical protein